MLIHKLTHAQCREVLGRATIARLACSRGDQPYVVPVQLFYDPDRESLYGFSTLGQKITWMRENPKVCVEVEEISNKFHWATVLAFGTYEELQPSPGGSFEEQAALDLFQQRREWWLPGAGKLAGDEEHHMPVVYSVRISRLTGRRAARASESSAG